MSRRKPKSAGRSMPRLLPRLLKALQEAPLTHMNSKRVARSRNVGPCKRKSLYRPMPISLPSFHLAGRTRSILLEENPVTDKRVFTRHKRLPPRVRLGPRPVLPNEDDVPREMTTQEREWWSSPYRAFHHFFLRSSPIRPLNDSSNVGDPAATMHALQKVSTQRYVSILSCTGVSHIAFVPRFSRQTRGTTLTCSAGCSLNGGSHARWTRTSEIQAEESTRRRLCTVLESGR